MRFDDSLRTVLAADSSTPFGARSAFRQLVDLIGRRRVAATDEALDRLRALRPHVPVATRAASARALALADPPAVLVAYFAQDDAAVAAPVLRTAKLSDAEWLALLPVLRPTGRGVLRMRSGLSPGVVRGLEAFGSTDFAIGHDRPAAVVAEPIAVQAALAPEPSRPIGQTFEIAELVQRIETFHLVQERREPALDARIERFAFEADPRGAICWVEGAPRETLIGRTIDPGDLGGIVGRRLHRGARLRIDGAGAVAGEWAISAVSLFEPESGRFVGFRGTARLIEEADAQAIEPDAIRRLVHELRTPTNAISGFAELIASQLMGPVAAAHRQRAETIGRDVRALIGAIDDLEISARVDSDALDLSPRPVDVGALLQSVVAGVLLERRLRVVTSGDLTVVADERALERLLARLAATVAASVPPGEQATVTVRGAASGGGVAVTLPWRLPPHDASLLGVDFALRLADKLASALGGRLVAETERLTLHLRTSFNARVQATTL